MIKSIKASQVVVKSSHGKDWEQDDHAIELFRKAYKHEINCRIAFIKAEGIVPFSEFHPDIAEEIESDFTEKVIRDQPTPLIYVYQNGDKFIMSDDYTSYYLYKEFRTEEIPCIVLGEIIDTKYIVEIGEPFYLSEQI